MQLDLNQGPVRVWWYKPAESINILERQEFMTLGEALNFARGELRASGHEATSITDAADTLLLRGIPLFEALDGPLE